MYSLINNESGITIVEVMVAVVILAIGLMSAAAMQTRAVDETTYSSKLTDRVTIAEQFMEDLMSRPIMESDPNADQLFTDPDYNDGTLQEAPYGTERGAYNVTYRALAGFPLESLTLIQVTVTPTGLSASLRQKRQMTFSYIRSTRFN